MPKPLSVTYSTPSYNLNQPVPLCWYMYASLSLDACTGINIDMHYIFVLAIYCHINWVGVFFLAFFFVCVCVCGGGGGGWGRKITTCAYFNLILFSALNHGGNWHPCSWMPGSVYTTPPIAWLLITWRQKGQNITASPAEGLKSVSMVI